MGGNNACATVAAAPTAPSLNKLSLLDRKESEQRTTSYDQYKEEVRQSRLNLAYRLRDALDVMDDISEAEFLEVIKTLSDGVTASDLIEKFRRYKALTPVKKKKKKVSKEKTK